MYGFKGGDASQMQYPTVDSVRKEFYNTYPGSLDCEYENGRNSNCWKFYLQVK